MATRPPIPYLRAAVCSTWLVLILVTFAAFGNASPRSLIFLIVTMMIPPSVFLALWNDGPSVTVAELLRATDDRR
jgi:hypothetical protein